MHMATINKRLAASAQLTASNVTYYTAVNVRTTLDKVTLCNTSAAAVVVTMDAVDNGFSPGVVQRLISARSIAPGETYTCPEIAGHVLNAGDSIQNFASAGLAIKLRMSDRETSKN